MDRECGCGTRCVAQKKLCCVQSLTHSREVTDKQFSIETSVKYCHLISFQKCTALPISLLFIAAHFRDAKKPVKPGVDSHNTKVSVYTTQETNSDLPLPNLTTSSDRKHLPEHLPVHLLLPIPPSLLSVQFGLLGAAPVH